MEWQPRKLSILRKGDPYLIVKYHELEVTEARIIQRRGEVIGHEFGLGGRVPAHAVERKICEILSSKPSRD